MPNISNMPNRGNIQIIRSGNDDERTLSVKEKHFPPAGNNCICFAKVHSLMNNMIQAGPCTGFQSLFTLGGSPASVTLTQKCPDRKAISKTFEESVFLERK